MTTTPARRATCGCGHRPRRAAFASGVTGGCESAPRRAPPSRHTRSKPAQRSPPPAARSGMCLGGPGGRGEEGALPCRAAGGGRLLRHCLLDHSRAARGPGVHRGGVRTVAPFPGAGEAIGEFTVASCFRATSKHALSICNRFSRLAKNKTQTVPFARNAITNRDVRSGSIIIRRPVMKRVKSDQKRQSYAGSQRYDPTEHGSDGSAFAKSGICHRDRTR